MPKNNRSKVLVAADYFIKKQEADPKGQLTNKKLQKLLYYSQAWSLVLKNKALFPDEIEAWVHGPAIPVVYDVFKEFGRGDINGVSIDSSEFSALDESERGVLDMVWNIYGKYDGDYLEALSHSEEPWQKAREGLETFEISKAVIPQDSMRVYYERKLKEAQG